ncbi:ATP-grasp domain-containing protein [Cellulosimicrobium cellulans]|uniref:ATP-grasp domain-containing protein n=1 Tax=Cellulosimicrobium cellulans TaxID=1710 RepID=UPI0020CCC8BA|nr:ATP-grasp domain-containing protein [Cellulosimicrobium cellulans]
MDDLAFVPTEAVDWYVPFAPRDVAEAVAFVRSAGETVDVILCFGEWHLGLAVGTAQALGVPGPRLDVTRARQKDAMRAAFRAAGMRTPRSVVVDGDDVADDLPNFPVVVKPVDYSSSSGVALVTDEEQLRAALRTAQQKSFRGVALVEEFVRGPEFSVEGVVSDGRAIVVGVTQKQVTDPPWFVETGHLFPAELPEEARSALVDEACRAVAAVGLTACAFHCELRLGPDGPVCIEIAGRSGGDQIPRLVWEATGCDLYLAELAAILGEDPERWMLPTRQRSAAIRFLEAVPGTVVRWPSASAAARRLPLSECLVALGHAYPWYVEVPPLDGSGRRLGYCLVAGPQDDVRTAYEQATVLAPGMVR